MATKHFCDRCKKETGRNLLVAIKVGNNLREFDLCSGCLADFQGPFMNPIKEKTDA